MDMSSEPMQALDADPRHTWTSAADSSLGLQAAGNTASIASALTFKLPPKIKSQCGSLLGVLGGFIICKRDPDTVIAARKGVTYSIDVSIFPENATAAITMSKSKTSSFESTADFEELVCCDSDFVFPVTWSLFQRKVALLRCMVTQTGPTGKKINVASADIDLASVICQDKAEFAGIIPLWSVAKKATVESPAGRNTMFGWLMISLQFDSRPIVPVSVIGNNTDRTRKNNNSSLKNSDSVVGIDSLLNAHLPALSNMKANWELRRVQLVSSNSVESLGIRRELADSFTWNRPSTQAALGTRVSAISSLSLHIALTEMEVTVVQGWTSNGSNSTTSLGLQQSVSCCLRPCNDVGNEVQVVGERVMGTTNMKWSKEDLILSVDVAGKMFVAIHIAVYPMNGSSEQQNLTTISTMQSTFETTNSPSRIPWGECVVLLPFDALIRGLPVNLQLPLHDGAQVRVGLLSMSFQSTSVIDDGNRGNSMNPSQPISSKLFTRTNTVPSTPSDVLHEKHFLKVEFLEGNMSSSATSIPRTAGQDTVLHRDFCFESSLLVEGVDNSPSIVSRTGYLTTAALDNWLLSSRLSLAANVLTVVAAIANAGKDNCISLGIACRDAASMAGTLLGRARVALPLTLIRQRGKSFEQWVTFQSPSTAAGQNSREDSTVGRVRIRVTLLSEQLSGFPSLLTPESTGLGMVACRFMGVNSGRSSRRDDYSEKLLFAEMHSQVSHDGETGESKLMHLDAAVCQPIRFGPGLEMLTKPGDLGGLVHIGCGLGEVSFNVRSETSATAFTAYVPIMKLLPRRSSDSENTIVLPELEILLSKPIRGKNDLKDLTRSIDLNTSTRDANADPNHAISARPQPRMKIQGCFIPYVEGVLRMRVSKFKWKDQSISSFTDANNVSVRFSMGFPSPIFSFGNISLSSSASDESAIVCLSLSTFDLLHQESQVLSSLSKSHFDTSKPETVSMGIHSLFEPSKEYRSLMPLVIQVSNEDADKSLAKFLGHEDSSAGQEWLCGQLSTATLYFEALRQCATRSVHDSDINSAATSWKTATIELFHKSATRCVATIQLDITFDVLSLPPSVLEPVDKVFFGPNTNGAETARMELGLKQAFLLADTDKSNFVSSTELLNVIRQARLVKGNRPSSSTANIHTSPSAATLCLPTLGGSASDQTIGLSDASKLLMSLARNAKGSSTPSLNNAQGKNDQFDGMNDSELETTVMDIFRKLDVDGDGSISWWEWRSVLTASLSRSAFDEEGDHVSPFDPLLVSCFSAASLLAVRQKSLSPQQLQLLELFCEERDRMALLNSVGKCDARQGRAGGASLEEFTQLPSQQGLIGVDLELTQLAGKSKLANRLAQTVQSLRMSNNMLSRRLEDALARANGLQALQEQHNGEQEQLAQQQSERERVLLEFDQQLQSVHWQAQVQQRDQEAASLLTMIQQSKEREHLLTGKLQEHQFNLKLLKQQKQQERDIRKQQQSALLQEITVRRKAFNDKVSEREHRFQALVCLQMFLKRLVVPRMRAKAQEAAARIIEKFIRQSTARRHYTKQKDLRAYSATVIQKTYRGHLTRCSLKRQQAAALRIQSSQRRHKATQRLHSRKFKRNRITFLLKCNLAKIVQRLWRDWKQRKATQAAFTIQNAFRKQQLKSRFARRKQMLIDQRALFDKNYQAANILKRALVQLYNTRISKKWRQWNLIVSRFESERSKLFSLSTRPTDDELLLEANSLNDDNRDIDLLRKSVHDKVLMPTWKDASHASTHEVESRESKDNVSENCFWIALSENGAAVPYFPPLWKAVDDKCSSQGNGIDTSLLGRLQHVDMIHRIAEAFFLSRSSQSRPLYLLTAEGRREYLSSIPAFERRCLSLDHPFLHWYSTVCPPQPEEAPSEPDHNPLPETVDDAVAHSEPDVPLLEALMLPTDNHSDSNSRGSEAHEDEDDEDEDEDEVHFAPRLKKAVGYTINFSVDGNELDSLLAQVVQVDTQEELLGLQLLQSDESQSHSLRENSLQQTRSLSQRIVLTAILPGDDDQTVQEKTEQFARILDSHEEGELIWIAYDFPYLSWYDSHFQLLRHRNLQLDSKKEADSNSLRKSFFKTESMDTHRLSASDVDDKETHEV